MSKRKNCPKNDAQKSNNTRFDIIANIPYEILNLILSKLTQYTCYILLDVSKTWRQKVSAYEPVWSTIDFRGTIGDTVKNNIRLLPYVSKHVTKLIGCPEDPLLRKTLYGLLANGGFSKLQKLYLWNEDHLFNPLIVSLLLSVGKTLECLSMDVGNISTVDQQKILDACTELRSLQIVGNTSTTLLDMIRQSCKKLKRLSINGSQFTNKFKDGNDVLKEEVYSQQRLEAIDASSYSSTTGGIQVLELNPSLAPKDYISFIQENQATVETLYLEVWGEESKDEEELKNREDWELFGGACKFPNMRSFSFHSSNSLITPVITQVIQNSPHIQSLSIDGVFLVDPDEAFFIAIADMPCLQHLELIGSDGGEEEVEAMLDALGAKTKTLVSIKISFPEFQMDHLIDSLAGIRTLQHLELDNIRCESEEEFMVQLCSSLQSHPNIRSISLCEICGINDEILADLAAIQGLERLHLEDLSEITPDGVSVFNDTSIKLTIKNCHV